MSDYIQKKLKYKKYNAYEFIFNKNKMNKSYIFDLFLNEPQRESSRISSKFGYLN